MIAQGGTQSLGLYDFKRQLDAFGGVDYFRENLAGGYLPKARVMLDNGDIVQNISGVNNTRNPNTDMTGWLVRDRQIIVESVADLANIKNQKNGDIIFVGGLQGGQFTYNASRKLENNEISVFNGWVRKIEGYVTPFMVGAKADGVADDSYSIQKAITYAEQNNLICDGLGSTYLASNLIFSSNSRIENFNIKHNDFTTNLISTFTTVVNLELLENVYFYNVHVDGQRIKHSGLPTPIGEEDGGRHGFRFRRYTRNVTLEKCSAKYCATDGIELFPQTAGILDVKLIDCDFSWNRRHGVSADSVNGFTAIRCRFTNNNRDLPEAVGTHDDTLGIWGDRDGNKKQYGAGIDFEEYAGFAYSQNILLEDCHFEGNGYASLTVYRMSDYTTATNTQNVTIRGGFYGKGFSSATSIEVSPWLPVPTYNRAFSGYTFEDVDLGGGQIYCRYVELSVKRLKNVDTIHAHGNSILNVDHSGYGLDVIESKAYCGATEISPTALTVTKSNLFIPLGTDNTSSLNIASNIDEGASTTINHGAGSVVRGGLKFSVNYWGNSDISLFNGLEPTKSFYFNTHDLTFMGSIDASATLGAANYRFKNIYLVTAPTVGSDSRYKDHIQNIEEVEKHIAIEIKKNIKKYTLKETDNHLHIGVIAQEVEAIFNQYGLNVHDYKLMQYNAEIDRYALVYEQLIMFILSAI